MASMWMVRAGRGSELVDDFRQRGVVALGGEKLGSLASHPGKDALLKLYASQYPEMKEGARGVWASQFARFLKEMKSGDSIVTFDRDRRVYLLGTLTSEYRWEPGLMEDKPHVRYVQWTHQVPRDALGTAARNTLGAIQTLFKVSGEVEDELRSKQAPLSAPLPEVAPQKPAKKQEDAEADSESIRAEVLEKADEFIEDAISSLDWKEMQELVAGILRAMGYRTSVSQGGSDRGVDIFASPDGLGLQEPRIFVEVKHRPQTAMGSKEIRAFLGGRKQGDRCLYISTGGFTKDAFYEAERASTPMTLLNLPGLRKLLVEHCEQLDAETRAMVPLKRLYWPVIG